MMRVKAEEEVESRYPLTTKVFEGLIFTPPWKMMLPSQLAKNGDIF